MVSEKKSVFKIFIKIFHRLSLYKICAQKSKKNVYLWERTNKIQK